MALAPKQRQVMRFGQVPGRMLIAVGAVRSGKTVAACQGFAMWSQARHPGRKFIVAGQSVGQIIDNIVTSDYGLLDALTAIAPDKPPRFTTSPTPRIVVPQPDGGMSEYLIRGGDDEGDWKRIQGLTAAGAFLDEAASLAESFYMWVQTRCSVSNPEPKLWLTLNPAGRQHWLKKKVIDRRQELDARVVHFGIHDNPHLSDAVKQAIIASQTGHFKLRAIDGVWADVGGLVFPVWFAADKLPPYTEEHKEGKTTTTDIVRWSLGFDWGESTVTAALLFAHVTKPATIQRLGKRRVAVTEYYHDAREKGFKSQQQHVDDVVQMLRAYTDMKPDHKIAGNITTYGDPSTPEGVKMAFRKHGVRWRDADNSVQDGIAMTSAGLVTGDVTIWVDGCPNLVRELAEYVWDEKAMERGEDKPVKGNDHAPDAMRYNVATVPGSLVAQHGVW